MRVRVTTALAQGPRADASVDAVRTALRTPGTPLAPELLEELQVRFGTDLRDIRLHDDSDADRAARALGARALTVGRDILLAQGEGAPGTPVGRRLLLHEIAHAAQSPPADGARLRVAPAAEAQLHEARAERAAGGAARGAALPAAPGMIAPGTILPLLQDAVLPPARVDGADPFTETMARDVAAGLRASSVDAGARAQRRLSRMPEADRTAVLARLQALLTPQQRERFAGALGQAADLENETTTHAVAATAPAAATDTRPAAETDDAIRIAPEGNIAVPAVTARSTDSALQPGAPTLDVTAAEPSPQSDGVRPQDASAPPTGDRPVPAPPVAAPAPAGDDAAAPAAVDYGAIDGASDSALANADRAGTAAGHASAPAGAAPATPAQAEHEAAEAEAMADEAELHSAQTAQPAREAPVTAAPSTAVAPAVDVASEVAPPVGPALPSQAIPEAATPETTNASTPEPPSGMPADLGVEPEAAAGVEPEAAAGVEPEAPVSIEPEAPAGVEPEPIVVPQPATVSAPTQPRADQPAFAPVAVAPALSGPTPTGAAALGEVDPPAPETPAADGASSPDAAVSEAPAGGEPAAEAPADSATGAETAGGDCGPDSAPGVGGASAGGDGAADAEPPPAPNPDVSAAEPGDALQHAGTLPATQMQTALGSVRSASTRSVGNRRDELAADPPTIATPDPIAPGEAGAEDARVAARSARRAVASASADQPGHATVPQLPPAPEPNVPAPALPPNETAISDAQARALRASVDEVPVTDPALNVDAGPPRTLALTGDANPQAARDQHDQLVAEGREVAAQGAVDVATPAGEDHLFPQRPSETLRATATGAGIMPAASPPPVSAPATGGGPRPAAAGAPGPGGAAAPSGPGVTAAANDRALDAIAHERGADRIAAATTQGVGAMQAGDEQQRTEAAGARQEASADMERQIEEDRDAQTAERRRARAAVTDQRRQWTGAQRESIGDHQGRANTELARATDGAQRERSAAEGDARQQLAAGNREIAGHRRDAEREARTRRDSARQESSGVLGWLANQARRFFRALKEGIHRIFNAARQAINAAINRIGRAIGDLIDAARRRIVGLIRAVGDALIAIGDSLLAAFPALRDRFRSAIHGLVDAAVNKVNELADALKAGLHRALAALSAALTALLDGLEAAYQAAIDVVARAVTSVIDAARAVVQALAQWAALISDIASDPGGWITRLGSAASDGFHNHLWRELKCAVKAWFRSKVEEVLGLPLAIFGLLRRGGLRLAEIGHMVWEGLKASIPGILIQLAIEKIMALLIPGAGLISAIIEFLRAAWPTISRIFAAFELFFAFLRAVRSGSAGRKFAQMVAAGVVVVLDFLANFLVRRLVGPARPVGGRLSALAQRIMARIRAAATAVANAARRVVRAVGRGVRAAGRAIRRAATATVGAVRRAGGRALAAVIHRGGRVLAAVGRRFPRLGRALGSVQRGTRRLVTRGRVFYRRQRARYRAWRARQPRLTPDERLARAYDAIAPTLAQMVAPGVAKPLLWLRLQAWRIRYRLTSLRFERDAGGLAVVGRASPPRRFIRNVVDSSGVALNRMIRDIGVEAMRDPITRRQTAQLLIQRRNNMRSGTPENPIVADPSAGHTALALLAQRSDRPAWYLERLRLAQESPEVMAELNFMGRRASQIMVGGPGRQMTYDTIAERLGQMRERGAPRSRPGRFVGGLWERLRGVGHLRGSGLQARQRLEATEAFHIFVHTEGGRSPANTTTHPLLASMVASGRITPRQALIDLNTLAGEPTLSGRRRGANERMRRVNAALGFSFSERDPSAESGRRRDVWGPRDRAAMRDADVQHVLEVEREILIHWIQAQMEADPRLFGDEASLRRWIRTRMRQTLTNEAFRELVTLRLAATAPPTGGGGA